MKKIFLLLAAAISIASAANAQEEGVTINGVIWPKSNTYYKMKKILILMLAVLCTSIAFGQVKKVAILEPIARGGTPVSPIQKEIVLGALEKAITNIDGYNAFTRTDIDAINFEQSFQQNGMVDDAQRKKLGTMSGVDYICISILTPDKESGDIFIKCSLIEMKSGQLDNSDNELMKLSPNSEINEGCKRLSIRLLKGKSESNPSAVSKQIYPTVTTINIRKKTTTIRR
jgi:hypothetical protein